MPSLWFNTGAALRSRDSLVQGRDKFGPQHPALVRSLQPSQGRRRHSGGALDQPGCLRRRVGRAAGSRAGQSCGSERARVAAPLSLPAVRGRGRRTVVLRPAPHVGTAARRLVRTHPLGRPQGRTLGTSPPGSAPSRTRSQGPGAADGSRADAGIELSRSHSVFTPELVCARGAFPTPPPHLHMGAAGGW